MPLGRDLKRAFDNQLLIATNPTREVDLFRCLIAAINSIPSYQAFEIHGNKSQVQYTETEGWFSRKPRCELGDVAIIAFSPRRKQSRLVIVQNKRAYQPGGGLGTNKNEVRANLVQFELLSKRPYFKLVRGACAGVRNGLIRFSPYSSVCQYGIFYDSGTGTDMSVITADRFNLVSKHKRTGKHPTATVRFWGAFQSAGVRYAAPDFVAAETIEDFGDLLEDLYIGRPITSRAKQEINRLLFNLTNMRPDAMHTNILNDFYNMEIVEQFDINMHDEDLVADDFWELLDVCRSLVLIDVDAQTNDDMINCQR